MNSPTPFSTLLLLLVLVGCAEEPASTISPPSPSLGETGSPSNETDVLATEADRKPEGLSKHDQALAEAQEICPVCGNPLAGVPRPIKLTIANRIIFADSQDCWAPLMTDPETYFAKLDANGDSHASADRHDATPKDDRRASTSNTPASGAIESQDQIRAITDAEQEIHGKALAQWINQSLDGNSVEDRQDALQVLRNVGLNHDRERTLDAFSKALKDPELQALAAAGLRKAGPPIPASTKTQLYHVIASELEGKDRNAPNTGLLMRVLSALGATGDADDIPKLQALISEHADVRLVSQLSQRAIDSIEGRSGSKLKST